MLCSVVFERLKTEEKEGREGIGGRSELIGLDGLSSI